MTKGSLTYEKKALAILLALSVLALSACAAKQANSDTQKDSNTAEMEQQPDSAQTAETQQPAQEAKRIEPLPESLDLNALTDADRRSKLQRGGYFKKRRQDADHPDGS